MGDRAAMLAETEVRDVRTSPRWRLPLPVLVDEEASVRREEGSPTAPAWAAWADLVDDLDAVDRATSMSR